MIILFYLPLGTVKTPSDGYFPEKIPNPENVAPTTGGSYKAPNSQDSYGSPLAKPQISNYGAPAHKPPAPVGAPYYVSGAGDSLYDLIIICYRARRPAGGWVASFLSTPANLSLTSLETSHFLSTISSVEETPYYYL